MNLSLNEAIDVAQNHPLWRLMSTFGARHSEWRMPEMMMMIMLGRRDKNVLDFYHYGASGT